MSISPRVWFALGWVVLLLTGLAVGVRPRLRTLDRLKSESGSLTVRAVRADSGADELARLESRLNVVQRVMDTRVRDIPAEPDAAGLIRSLTSYLDTLGMSEREITTGATTDTGDALSAPTTVKLKGPFVGVYEAIRWLETLPRLVCVVRVQIETPRRTAGELFTNAGLHVQAELLLHAYSDPDRMATPPSTASVRTGQGGSP